MSNNKTCRVETLLLTSEDEYKKIKRPFKRSQKIRIEKPDFMTALNQVLNIIKKDSKYSEEYSDVLVTQIYIWDNSPADTTGYEKESILFSYDDALSCIDMTLQEYLNLLKDYSESCWYVEKYKINLIKLISPENPINEFNDYVIEVLIKNHDYN